MMRLELIKDGFYALYFSYSPRLVEQVKKVPGLVWNTHLRAWVGYLDAFLEAGAPISDLAKDCLGPEVLGQVVESDARLRPYQQEGVRFLLKKGGEGALLADGMGFGKSAQAIAASKALNGRTIVVCPSFVREVWRREFSKWHPEARLFMPEGVKSPAPVTDEFDVVVIHYDIMYAWVDCIAQWVQKASDLSLMVLDECHFIASEKARRSKAVMELRGYCKYVVGLSGTPLTSRPRDLWNVVNTLSPGRFGPFFRYAVRYCDGHQETVGAGAYQKDVWNFGGRSNLDELKRRLSHFMLRRTHSDVNLELPAMTRQVVELKVPKRAQVAVARGLSNKTEMRRVLDLAADAKLKEVVSMLKQHLEDGHNVVAFCYRRAVAEMLVAECGGWYMHGGVPQAKRNAQLSSMREHAKADKTVFLAATIDCASVGIDLTFADVVVFVELTWEPHELAQAEARVYRFGQGRPTLIQYTIALGTADELVRDGCIRKLDEVMAPVLGKGTESLSFDLKGGKTDEQALEDMWRSL